MPRRTDISSILIIGAGPIVIGQACEFDYSGAQACKALREEGYRVILIAKERPDALLPTMGGQTGLNCALDLARHGVLEKYDVEMIAASREAIDMAEDRDLFRQAMSEIGLESPTADIAHSLDEALDKQQAIGFPTIIRPSFTLGGTGGGIAYNREEFERIVSHGLEMSPTTEVLLEESVIGWKEFEMEVVRDKNDNCIIVCSIENFDPMGVHTGDSITVAPAQTLTDKEYQRLRDASIDVLRKIGVETGGSNVQFAVCPDTGRVLIIEMNPRVSRSSALASKATGFPIAKVAAKLAVGYTLDELKNDITGGLTPASFEPAIDYVVTKIPRFTFEKFPGANDRLTTQMKSVGEVMSIGRNFQESLQKALRGLETGITGLDEVCGPIATDLDRDHLRQEMRIPGSDRILYVADAMRHGYSYEDVAQVTGIDPWFLVQIADLVNIENDIRESGLQDLNAQSMRAIKRKGFSDARVATLVGADESAVRRRRLELGVRPVFKRVDTCAAEFATTTAYMYSTYEDECEAEPTDNPKIMILGGGPNRIGQGIEFDYCCVHAALALRETGYETIMVNCNPETVSTDYDTSDRLYFESLTFEDVMEIIEKEQPKGVIVQYGGQTPLKLARDLEAAGAPIIGTSPDSIDLAEDRERFQRLVQELGLKQPPNRTASSKEQALELGSVVGYPLVVRPSYVLGGRAMEIVHTDEDLAAYMDAAIDVSNSSPVLLDRFLDLATEVDVDCICDGERVLIGGVMEHIEQAGVHSGDSGCSLPPFSLTTEVQKTLEEQVVKLARGLNVVGLMNTQFAIQGDVVYLLEVNPRASRTAPFVSKAIGLPLAKIAAKVMVGESLAKQGFVNQRIPDYFSVKEAVFPFIKFPGADPILGPEMKSTGEVMGVGRTFGEAYAKAQLASGVILPRQGAALLSVRERDKDGAVELAKLLADMGFDLVATHGTAKSLAKAGVECRRANKVREGRPHIVDMIKNGEIDLIVNTTEGESESIRAEAVRKGVTYYTTLGAAVATCRAIEHLDDSEVNRLQDLHKEVVA
jgi:carbamoyl-phosphate synthase large subunit